MAIIKWSDKNLYDPWSDFKRLQDEINDLFDVDRVPRSTGIFDRSFSPAIDVIEYENNIIVDCELPGLDQKDIDISIASNVLTIKGSKQDELGEKKGKLFKKESWSGNFQRTLSLPVVVDVDKIRAEMENGILKIILPKKEEAKPKQISINIK